MNNRTPLEHNKINQEFKKKWIAALLSGEYEQGVGLLRNEDNKFCCLGVACNLIDPTKWIYTEKDQLERALDKPAFGWGDERTIYYIPDELRDQIGLDRVDMKHLAEINDSCIDFVATAEWIEENL